MLRREAELKNKAIEALLLQRKTYLQKNIKQVNEGQGVFLTFFLMNTIHRNNNFLKSTNNWNGKIFKYAIQVFSRNIKLIYKVKGIHFLGKNGFRLNLG